MNFPSASKGGDEISREQVRVIAEQALTEALDIAGAIEQQRTAVQSVIESDIEKAKRLKVIELHIHPETAEGRLMIQRMGELHDECLTPASALRDFMQGKNLALQKSFEHGSMPDVFNPSPEERALYEERSGHTYTAPYDVLLAQLNNHRPGSFHILALTDTTKNPSDTEWMKGYITFRLPPRRDEGANIIQENRNTITEILSLDPTRPGANDTTFIDGWDRLQMIERQIDHMMELDTLVVQRGSRKCGGPLILVDAMIKFLQEHGREQDVTKMYCTVFAGFDIPHTVPLFDDGDDDTNLTIDTDVAVGENIGSLRFFTVDLGCKKFSERNTPTEILIRDIGEHGEKRYESFKPRWYYLYNSLNNMRKLLAQSEILYKYHT